MGRRDGGGSREDGRGVLIFWDGAERMRIYSGRRGSEGMALRGGRRGLEGMALRGGRPGLGRNLMDRPWGRGLGGNLMVRMAGRGVEDEGLVLGLEKGMGVGLRLEVQEDDGVEEGCRNEREAGGERDLCEGEAGGGKDATLSIPSPPDDGVSLSSDDIS